LRWGLLNTLTRPRPDPSVTVAVAVEGRFTVRALVLHLPVDTADAVEDAGFKLLEAKDRVEGELGVRVESARVTINVGGSPERLAEEARVAAKASMDGGFFVNLGPTVVRGEDDVDLLASVAEEGVFFSVLLGELSWDRALLASKLFHEAARRGVDYPVYFGVNTLGEPIVTPYYPLSSAPPGRRLVTAAITYPNYLAEAYRAGGLASLRDAALKAGRVALRAAESAAEIVGAGGAAVDLSVAPWMQETTLGLVELVAGVRLPEPGFAAGVRLVNEAIAGAAGELGAATGFNEVQLPVAEDLKLKARVSEGDTTARDLARLSGVCLAGLDMVVVPADVRGVAGLILEVASYARAKRAPLGVRLVPVEDVEPGDKVFLERFGEVPVISV